jgi:hypothetical protein
MTWTFRNRIDMQPHSRLQYPEPEWILEESGSDKQVKLVGRQPPVNIPVVQLMQDGLDTA